MKFFIENEFIKRLITGALIVLGLCLAYIFLPVFLMSLILLIILFIILFFEWPQFKILWLTPIYPILPFILLILLNQSSLRDILFPLLFIATFCYDTGGYLVGTILGKHKIFPSISPKKSWEGAVGGLLFAFLGVYIFFAIKKCSISLINILIICLMLTVAATLGDFFESYLKRRAGIKDSGTLLPGHGGLLDRFDGILGAVLILYFLRYGLILLIQKCL